MFLSDDNVALNSLILFLCCPSVVQRWKETDVTEHNITDFTKTIKGIKPCCVAADVIIKLAEYLHNARKSPF